MMLSALNKKRRLKDLSDAVQHCTLCPRLCSRTKILSEANGSVHSRVLFVAEAPGRLGADKTGVPLFGDKTGDNFDVLLASAGWKRRDVFVTNAILCNPRDDGGNNSTPTSEEILNCARYLEMTINLVEPDVVVSLGAIALNALGQVIPHSVRLASGVGQSVPWGKRLLVPLYHPGPRALIHRSLVDQQADFAGLAKWVHPLEGLQEQAKAMDVSVSEREPTPFEQLVLAVVQYLGRVTRFKLTKLLYLIDYHALMELGASISQEVYLRQEEGPWPPGLVKTVQALQDHEVISRFEKKMPVVSQGPSPRFDINLPYAQLELAVNVLGKYGELDNSAIKSTAYRTAPMRYILRQERAGRDMSNCTIMYKNSVIPDASLEKPEI